jgi:hypothetical protein
LFLLLRGRPRPRFSTGAPSSCETHLRQPWRKEMGKKPEMSLRGERGCGGKAKHWIRVFTYRQTCFIYKHV